jgi:hypothetical protein
MHIYAFGSLCRGEVGLDSDVDLLAIVDHHDDRLDQAQFSIYSYRRILEIWSEGNPFAWHLSLEAKLLYGSDKTDHLMQLGLPSAYRQCVNDCRRFFALFNEARESLEMNNKSTIFDLSTVFLSIRNFASCYSLGVRNSPDFSRNSALHLEEDIVPLGEQAYRIFERARILCTRGYGTSILQEDVYAAKQSLFIVRDWMSKLIEKAENNERLQQSNCGPESVASVSECSKLAQRRAPGVVQKGN